MRTPSPFAARKGSGVVVVTVEVHLVAVVGEEALK